MDGGSRQCTVLGHWQTSVIAASAEDASCMQEHRAVADGWKRLLRALCLGNGSTSMCEQLQLKTPVACMSTGLLLTAGIVQPLAASIAAKSPCCMILRLDVRLLAGHGHVLVCAVQHITWRA
eukprot:36261-Pelagomonas_calceolata.AAC.1